MKMRKSTHLWREEDHPRDDWGRFCKSNRLYDDRPIDKMEKVGIMTGEAEILQIIGLKSEYIEDLRNKYAQGMELAKKLFEKYVRATSIGDCSYAGKSHFSPRDNKIYINIELDSKNERGAWTTFFHEYGHYIDFACVDFKNYKSLSTNAVAFSDALRTDFISYVNGVKVKNKIKAQEHLKYKIYMDLCDVSHHAISDIIGGCSGNVFKGKWGHKKSYWNTPMALEREAFAHMFEAMFDVNKYEVMEKYFPLALNEFNNMLGELI